jgi:hypothetical protein
MFIYIIPLLIIGFFLNRKASLQIHKKAELLLPSPYTPLPDLIHSIFPKIPIITPDYFLFICTGITIFNYNTLFNIEKNLLCVGICTIIRSFSIFLTIMPTCMPKTKTVSNIYTNTFLSTHDLMFSGHSLFFIAMGNMLNSFFIKYFGPFLLIIARQHYTIDVCVSGLVYFFIYMNIPII